MNGNKYDQSNPNGSTTDFSLSEKFLNVIFVFYILR